MKFKLDENLPTEVAIELQAAGHDATTVAEQKMTGAGDPDLLAHVQREGRILLTLDKGIADIRRFPPTEYAGIIVFRPPGTGRGETMAFVSKELPAVLRQDPKGRLLVVTERGIRIR